MKRRSIILVLALVVAAGAWYLFRPERLFVNARVNEALPGERHDEGAASSGYRILAAGNFHDGAHRGSGAATIYESSDGGRLLRLTNFETSNGPDVRVYLVAADDATDNQTVTRAGFIELGQLKGNIGDQNYDLPRDVDLDRYRSVTIWCRRFSVNFATAPLRSGKQS